MAVYRLGSELLPERRDVFRSRSRRVRRFGRIAKRRIVFSIAILFLIYLFRGLYPGNSIREPFTEVDVDSVWNSSQVNIVQNEDIFSDDQVSYIAFEKEGYPSSPALPRSRTYSFDVNSLNNISRSGTVGDDSILTDALRNRSGFGVPKNPRSSHRKKYFPCAVGFAEAVDDLVEPEVPMNSAYFSLKYIDKEEKPYGRDIFEPRFGGHQTLKERENSFYARNQTLHCGFVKGPEGSPSTGFDLYEKDKNFMATCRIVVSSCIFGSSDFLRRPTSRKISEYSKKNVCFVMFLDELTLENLFKEGQAYDDRGYIGLWRVVIVRNLPYPDMRKTGKVPKFLSHRLFPSARYSIWLDSKMRLQADPLLILEYFLWRRGSEYAISNHYDRHCVWEEVLQNKRLNKYNHTAIDEQFYFYQSDGLTKFNTSDPNTPLPSYVPEGSFIVRAHSPMSNLFSCLWFNEVDRFTSRDQLSFAYTFLKLRRMNQKKPFFLNMFKDCERRALAKLFRHRAVEAIPDTAL